MYKLFCLVGKSNTGKDTLAEALLGVPELGLSRLVLYTTRPRRPMDTEGETYHFVSPDQLEVLIRERGLIERRDYHTEHGLWTYCTLSDAEAQAHRLTVTPLPALCAYREHFGHSAVVPLYIEVPDQDRLLRAIRREANNKSPCYAEVCRRYLADEQDFSRENLSECGIGRLFSNIDFETCLTELTAEIRREIAENNS